MLKNMNITALFKKIYSNLGFLILGFLFLWLRPFDILENHSGKKERKQYNSCDSLHIQGIYIPICKTSGSTVFFLKKNSIGQTTYYLGLDAVGGTGDFYNYVKEGDSIVRINDTMFAYKPNGNITKWLLNCNIKGLGIDSLSGFGAPNAKQWRKNLQERALWKGI
jgi:hypothetical protein